MTTLTLRSLLAHRARLALTIVTVAFAVGFITAGFVLADSLRSTFSDVSENIYGSVDGEIRAGDGAFDRAANGRRFPEAALADVADIEGVAFVEPQIGGESATFSVDADGSILIRTGPPVLTFSVPTAIERSPFSLDSGEAPGTGEIMIDAAQARTLGVTLGDPVRVATPQGTETFTLSGTVTFGEPSVSPYFLLFDLPTAQRLLDAEGMVDSASLVFDEGADRDAVVADIEAALAAPLYVARHDELVGDQKDEFGAVIDVVQNTLLGFALITLIVSTFVIVNTFAVLVGRRRREIGLLRAVGARRRQAITTILAEAALVGVVASAVGLAVGLGIAEGIKALVEAGGEGGFPEGPTQLLPRTVALAVLVGVGVTTLAALVPALRAGRVAPLEAMATSTAPATTGSDRMHRVLRATIGRLGPVGQLATTGLARDPRRVVVTALPLVVGLAVIATFAVFADSYRSALDATVEAGYDADLIVTGRSGSEVSYAAVARVAALDEVDAAAGFGGVEVRHRGEVVTAAGHQSRTADGVVVLDPIAGATGPLGHEGVYVDEGFAAEHDLAVGDGLPVEFSDGFVADLAVVAVLKASPVLDAEIVLDAALVADHARNVSADFAAVRFDPGVDPGAADTAVREALLNHPELSVATRAEHVAERAAQVDQLRTLASGLLGLTILVALIGIANTAALGVMERGTEIRLLRSVGMSARQVRRMVGLEALVTSTLGAIVGIALGLAVAAGLSFLAVDALGGAFSIPVGPLALYAGLSALLGVIATLLPARRAARMGAAAPAGAGR